MLPEVACPEPVNDLAFVYILESADGALYVGQSVDLGERLRKHRLGLGGRHTHDHPCIGLVHVEGPLGRVDAVRRERQLKGWSRAKKLALIAGDVGRVKQLSRTREKRFVASRGD